MLGGLLVRQEGRQRGCLGQPEAVADARAREGVLDGVDEALGDRSAAVGDPANAADVQLGKLRMAHDGVVDRRHGHELVDAVHADRRKESVEVERVGEDLDPAPELEHRDQLAVAAGDVKQRDGHQRRDPRPLRAVDGQAAEGVLAVRREVGVGRHRPLREAGRSAGVEDRRQVVRAEVLDRHRARHRAASRLRTNVNSASESPTT